MKRLLVLLVLAGCAETVPPPSGSPSPDEAGARTERDQRARFACDARGRMASATPAFGTGMGGQMGGMLAQQAAGDTVAQRCWERYRATGVLPSS
ncbi:hypothetical protein [Roseococcus pinisoli]|uniref:Lipoprotein n=1 Tax=Roseococcus pinisoli TaxID=2835040 RepID=A0ABS5Q9C0_9PROT|nr:hypothetical protein [Roseococcus pinisoli]MBS7810315.1 hypothetical protein [Roseococcus pinisoli]